jgi:hypothetical protein
MTEENIARGYKGIKRSTYLLFSKEKEKPTRN